MTDIRELLPLYALGVLDADESQVVERAVAADPALAAELAALEASTAELVTPIAPSPDVHARLMASIGGGAFERFSGRMASLFDVTVERAREILGLVERPASWEIGAPGVHLVHFAGGPAYAAADCGFVRLDPGTPFPLHTHVGEEVSLVLAGRLRDRATGQIFQPGDEIAGGAGASHDVVCEGTEPCMYAARAMDGIAIGGTPVRPHKK